jgi:pimeloyl-ACP methyl ester carboxylesterase
MTAAGEGPADRWFDGAGVRLHGLDWGGPPNGPAILLLHGVGGNAWIWDDVAPRLRAALPGHRVVAIDQRDGGASDHPRDAYGRADFTDDVLAVAAALGTGPLTLVGHSRGGWLAAWIAAAHPEAVERLVLVDPARLAFADGGASDQFFAWVEGSLGPFASREAAIDWARSQDRAANWTAVRTRSFLFGLREESNGSLVGKLPRAAVGHLQEARRDPTEVTAAVAGIRQPTLLLVAERQSPARRADKLRYADVITGTVVRSIDGSHFLHTDAPAEVAAAIAEFVASGPAEAIGD